MKIAMQLPYVGDFDRSAQQVVALEQAGLDLVFVAEAYGFDAPSFMGYLAARTERVEIASGIIPIYTRTPSLLAMTAAGVDALSGGRCVLGLGASGPQVVEGFHGVPYSAPLGRTREIVDICRQVWRRERVEHDGRHYQVPLPAHLGTGLGKPLKLITHPTRERIPIWIAALGERNVALTAEVAEGWLPLFFVPEQAKAVWGDALAEGTARRDPALGPLDVAAGGLVAIGDHVDVDRALDRARPMTALYIGGMGAREKNFYNQLVGRYGWEREAALIQDLYLAGKKDEAAAAVPRELLAQVNLVGPAGHVAERIAAFREAGVTYLNVQNAFGDPVATLRQLRELVDSVG